MPAADPGVYRTPPIYRILDNVSGALVLFVIVWAPWALGSTTATTISILTALGYALGVVWITKRFFCRRFDFEPVRWVDDGGWPIKAIAALTALLLLYVAISLVNKRAIAIFTYNAPSPKQITGVELQWYDSLSWLPASFDWPRTLNALIRYGGAAAMFWATRDWLVGKTRNERHHAPDDSSEMFPTGRAKLALWTLSISASALALVGILQRFDHAQKLLWLFEHHNPLDFTFGPYPYRGTGAQYLNLIIPVTLGFWWALREQDRRRSGTNRRAGGDAHVILLPCVVLMAAGTTVTASRGGFGIMVTLLLLATMILATARRATAWLRISMLGTLIAAAGVGLLLGGVDLQKRFREVEADKLSGRGKIWETSHRMASDFHLLGSGAETYCTLYASYRANENADWAAYAHNDWLETLITFGWCGSSIIYGLLLAIPLASQFATGIPTNREFRLLILLAMGGVLAHGGFDFPFQIYSIVYTFAFLAALASVATKR